MPSLEKFDLFAKRVEEEMPPSLRFSLQLLAKRNVLFARPIMLGAHMNAPSVDTNFQHCLEGASNVACASMKMT